jgi:hypothetical protein
LRGGRAAAALLAVAGIAGTSSVVSAHRLDECLQAARIAVEPDRVEIALALTPGVEMVESLIADIDRDGDRQLSASEQQAFAARVVSALDVSHDRQALELSTASADFPDLDALRRGEATIHVRSSAALPALREGRHEISFDNQYRPEVSVYLANALVPESTRVAVTAQRRTHDQRELTIAYTLGPGRSNSLWVLSGVAVTLMGLLGRHTRAFAGRSPAIHAARPRQTLRTDTA